MVCRIAIGLILVILLLIFVWSFRVWLLFKKYCERIAKLENRSDELLEYWGRDDSGLNKFEREHFWKIFQKNYLSFNDPLMEQLGKKLRSLLITNLIIAITFISFVVYVQLSICR